VARLVLLFVAGAALTGCNADCTVEASTAADYAAPESWLCHPDLDDDACTGALETVEVLPDNSVEAADRTVAVDPGFDCFYVYPTVDLRLRPQLHADLTDDEDELRVVRTQAARFAEVCQVWAPRYRQVTLGTYVGRADAVEPCFDVAFEDVARAFDVWAAASDPDRGVLLVGHSQGGQIVSRLLGFRSYAAGNEVPGPSDRFGEGDDEVCVHPGAVAAGEAPLAGAVFSLGEGSLLDLPADVDVGDADYVLYRDYFSANCEFGSAVGLEVSADPAAGDERSNPVPFDDALLSGSSGTHVLDVQFGMLDLVARAGAMGEA